MSNKPLAVLGAALFTASLAQAGGDQKPYSLMVGDKAPALKVKEWVQGDAISGFQAGQHYVVEFWATWCGPCRKAIPHMSELQAQYGDDVRFVGVSIWETIDEERAYAVPAFVEKMGEKMSYTVASDRTQKDDEAHMAKAWMDAAGQRGIPTAFIVDGTGTIAWIGSPFEIDEPLEQIHAGEWNLAVAATDHAQRMEKELAYEEFAGEVKLAGKEKRWADALAAMDRAFQEYPEWERGFAQKRYEYLNHAGRTADASAYGRKLVEGVLAESAGSLNYLAWGIVDPEAEHARRDVALAVLAAHRANELTEWKEPAILDTYGLALFLSGERAKAIEVQEKAVKYAVGTPYEGELKQRLEEFKKEVQAGV